MTHASIRIRRGWTRAPRAAFTAAARASSASSGVILLFWTTRRTRQRETAQKRRLRVTLRCTTAIFCGRRAGWQHRVGHCSQRRPVGGVISKNWGFDLRTVSVPKVMISFIQRGRSQVPSCACPVADRALPEPGIERCGQRRRQPLGQNPSEPTWQADAEDAQRRLNGDFLEALVAM